MYFICQVLLIKYGGAIFKHSVAMETTVMISQQHSNHNIFFKALKSISGE